MGLINKKDIILALEKIAVYLEIKGENSFKVSAYRKAANALERDERTIEEIEDPSTLQGIGKGTAAVIQEILETGQSKLLIDLMEELPSGLLPLLKVPNLGGKKIGKLYRELNVIDVETLQKACEDKKVQKLAGFGEKTEEKILSALADFGKRPERLTMSQVLPIGDLILTWLSEMKGIQRYELAGSFRRARETVKDLDFIISTDTPEAVGKQLVEIDNIKKVVSHGETKISVEFQFDDIIVPADFRMVKDNEFATTLHHFTGSKDHNVQMRQIAKSRGEKISEYGVENEETGEIKTFESETAFYKHFNLHFIPPEIREGKEEISTFENQHQLVSFKDIRADLHMHTTWSDGAHSIEEMIEACRKQGYEYMAITDHSKYLRVANGLTVERLKRQHEEIRIINEKYKDFTVFTGIEMDILPDGSLDYEDNLLKDIDFVIASIHSSFQQDVATIMGRLQGAMENPHVDMIAHPTGRVIGRRTGYPVDMERLIEMAVDTNTILELNGNPNRLDLSAEWVKKAQDKGAKIAVNTDAHRYETLDHMLIGIKTARRGWLEKETVVNTWTVNELQQFINRT
ncbi:DNA polymerase/3'-5' exonuclease PolX [Evansella sp. AB-P1]|uniref:DNA polymerase/3'-5' exonuclease PolX n=1 Tax=Evansella sp. AB-P1 TaxID=3037653 RepID=UPI00241DFC6B|nr:DNA polymerase/3'-5' exonuclease PolX [Evansella sp. AB-P1]MDG5786935.1 DNA polymerase/3'-5' exonuclease PolX [Evansella sp. AB-P1]